MGTSQSERKNEEIKGTHLPAPAQRTHLGAGSSGPAGLRVVDESTRQVGR